MPLSEPAGRELLHRRDIVVKGYRRTDGLFDIEAEIADAKAFPITLGDRGTLEAGAKLHLMRLRLTVDATLTIIAAEAVTEAGPFSACPGGAMSFAGLAGLRIRAGFMRDAMVRIGGVAGCTHIRELVQQMATVAIQTLFGQQSDRRGDAEIAARMVDSCHSYAADGPVVQRRWPALYTGADRAAAD